MFFFFSFILRDESDRAIAGKRDNERKTMVFDFF